LQLARGFAEGRTTPLEHLRHCLARIEQINARLNAFLSLDVDAALAAAEASGRRWAAGSPLSPLDGLTFGIKANIAVRGWPWHGGVAAYADRRAERDAAVVARLRAAGGVLIGGLNMDEGGLGARGGNLHFGACVNPLDEGWAAGGSSSGAAAAVSAGLCVAALGTDTLGSVRIPASFCGVTGHLPRGRALPLEGVMPLSFTLDSVGVLTRRPRDAAMVLRVLLSGVLPRPAGPASGVKGRCAVVAGVGGRPLDPRQRRALEACQDRAAALGLRPEPIRLPLAPSSSLARACLFIAEAEAAVEHEALLGRRPDGFGADFKSMLAWASRQPALKLASAYRILAEAGRDLRRALQPYEFLLTPATPFPAWSLEDPEPPGVSEFTVLANACGLAATAFPVGDAVGAPPLSAQLMGWSDQRTLLVAERLAGRGVGPS
jgi:aspartyl-tRNA(Asn)/glutamyl-tRNA(Gln) amidotransferase subunit A